MPSRLSSLPPAVPLALTGALVLAALTLFAPRPGATGQDADAPATPPRTHGDADPGAGPEEPPFVELAPLMGELQRLTHKLSLSVRHQNHELAEFYLYESLESIADMQEEVPEYRGFPVALLLDQIAKPAYQTLADALAADRADRDAEPSAPAALTALVESCNQCHAATRHAFIRITDRGDFNPFNQDFAPAPAQ